MRECKELAGKVVRNLILDEEGEYGPEVNIEFTDGSIFNICIRNEPVMEARHSIDEGGIPRVLGDYSTPPGRD